jgi:hypothetical protein
MENGRKRTKYVPKKILNKIKEAEYLKLPVSDILVLLGGDEKNPRKSSNTFDDGDARNAETNIKTSVENPRKTIPPSTRRRKQGYGGGYIECKPIIRGGKQYKQYWYHYEEWDRGNCLVKKSKYIPKRLLARVEKLEGSKAPVREILEVLGVEKL